MMYINPSPSVHATDFDKTFENDACPFIIVVFLKIGLIGIHGMQVSFISFF